MCVTSNIPLKCQLPLAAFAMLQSLQSDSPSYLQVLISSIQRAEDVTAKRARRQELNSAIQRAEADLARLAPLVAAASEGADGAAAPGSPRIDAAPDDTGAFHCAILSSCLRCGQILVVLDACCKTVIMLPVRPELDSQVVSVHSNNTGLLFNVPYSLVLANGQANENKSSWFTHP